MESVSIVNKASKSNPPLKQGAVTRQRVYPKVIFRNIWLTEANKNGQNMDVYYKRRNSYSGTLI